MYIKISRPNGLETKKEINTTDEAIGFWEKESIKYGEILTAEMDKGSKLTLISEYSDKILFEGALTSGYPGEGSRGTLKILKMAGFDIVEDHIYQHKSFKITKII